MLGQRSIRRGSKWVCTFVAAACLAGFAVSLLYWVAWRDSSYRVAVWIEGGFVGGKWGSAPRTPPPVAAGFEFAELPAAMRGVGLWPRVMHNPNSDSLEVPLWMPFLVTAGPAAWLWRKDRRLAKLARVGKCTGCGYDRAGVGARAKCPECGLAETSPSQSRR
ncbi:MAG TPA: hypothetical protein VD997_15240 [Phycisphaerales bacterium]|nr:hypothetical protein [Phycisphaerales bacterium]